jgi:hypothetical protein
MKLETNWNGIRLSGMRTVREVSFTHADEIRIGRMTRECWKSFGSDDKRPANTPAVSG